MLTQHKQLVLEGDAQTQFNQYEMTSRLREESNHSREMCERLDISAQAPMTEVQTLSQQLKAKQCFNNIYLQKSRFCEKKLQSSEIRINISETRRLANGRQAQLDIQVLLQKVEDG